MTPRDLIKGSLRLIGVLASGEAPQATEQSEGLQVLNEMLDSWSADGLMIPFVTREEFPLIASQASYTMGDTGDFDTERPTQITFVGIKDTSVELPIQIITSDEWAMIPSKDSSTTIPTKVYAEGTNPLETLNFWPVPSEVKTVVIQSLKAFTSITSATLGTDYELPPGYQQAVRYNLALLLAPEYGKSAAPEVVATANFSLEQIKRKNFKPQYMESDALGLTRNRVLTNIFGE